MSHIRIKRIYDPPEISDGYRVLVDRLWPRGVSKGSAKIDLWMKEIAPSTELRQWFHHDPDRWEEFKTRYRAELRTNREALERLRVHAEEGPLTLLYGAKDVHHNHAMVLKAVLEQKK